MQIHLKLLKPRKIVMELCLDFCTQQHAGNVSLNWGFNAKFPKATSSELLCSSRVLLKIQNILSNQSRLRVIQAGLPGMCVPKDDRLWKSPKAHPKHPPAVTYTPVREPGLFQGEFLQELVPVLQELPHVGLHQGDADALLPAAASPVHAVLVIVVHHACKHSNGLLGTHTEPWGGFWLSFPSALQEMWAWLPAKTWSRFHSVVWKTVWLFEQSDLALY